VLPAEVRSALPLRKGERALAGAPDASGRYVVASTYALHLPADSDGSTERSWERLGWEQVEHAEWERDDERLRVTPVVGFGERARQRTVAMSDAPDVGQRRVDRLLAVIRERVTASVLLDRQVPIGDDYVFRVVA